MENTTSSTVADNAVLPMKDVKDLVQDKAADVKQWPASAAEYMDASAEDLVNSKEKIRSLVEQALPGIKSELSAANESHREMLAHGHGASLVRRRIFYQEGTGRPVFPSLTANMFKQFLPPALGGFRPGVDGVPHARRQSANYRTQTDFLEMHTGQADGDDGMDDKEGATKKIDADGSLNASRRPSVLGKAAARRNSTGSPTTVTTMKPLVVNSDPSLKSVFADRSSRLMEHIPSLTPSSLEDVFGYDPDVREMPKFLRSALNPLRARICSKFILSEISGLTGTAPRMSITVKAAPVKTGNFFASTTGIHRKLVDALAVLDDSLLDLGSINNLVAQKHSSSTSSSLSSPSQASQAHAQVFDSSLAQIFLSSTTVTNAKGRPSTCLVPKSAKIQIDELLKPLGLSDYASTAADLLDPLFKEYSELLDPVLEASLDYLARTHQHDVPHSRPAIEHASVDELLEPEVILWSLANKQLFQLIASCYATKALTETHDPSYQGNKSKTQIGSPTSSLALPHPEADNFLNAWILFAKDYKIVPNFLTIYEAKALFKRSLVILELHAARRRQDPNYGKSRKSSDAKGSDGRSSFLEGSASVIDDSSSDVSKGRKSISGTTKQFSHLPSKLPSGIGKDEDNKSAAGSAAPSRASVARKTTVIESSVTKDLSNASGSLARRNSMAPRSSVSVEKGSAQSSGSGHQAATPTLKWSDLWKILMELTVRSFLWWMNSKGNTIQQTTKNGVKLCLLEQHLLTAREERMASDPTAAAGLSDLVTQPIYEDEVVESGPSGAMGPTAHRFSSAIELSNSPRTGNTNSDKSSDGSDLKSMKTGSSHASFASSVSVSVFASKLGNSWRSKGSENSRCPGCGGRFHADGAKFEHHATNALSIHCTSAVLEKVSNMNESVFYETLVNLLASRQ